MEEHPYPQQSGPNTPLVISNGLQGVSMESRFFEVATIQISRNLLY